MTKQIKCKVCNKPLDRLELDFYKRTKVKICLDCENQGLDDLSEELDRVFERLSKE